MMNTAESLARAIRIVLILGVAVGATPSHAFRMSQDFRTGGMIIPAQGVACNDPNGFIHRNGRNVNFYHNTGGQGAGKAAALRSAMASWTKVRGATHILTYAGTTTRVFQTDGWNTVSWGTNQNCTGSCLALHAVTLQSGQVATESDIVFNPGHAWRTDGAAEDTESTAAHEFGHVFGIFHTDLPDSGPFTTPTMYVDSSPFVGTVEERSLEPDDEAALQCAQSRYPAAAECVPSGSVDDTLYETGCCSGYAVHGSTVCDDPADYGGTWESCNHICGTRPVNGCIPSGGIDDTLYSTRCCSGAAVPGSTWCLDPADFGGDWSSCIQVCQ